MTLSMYFFLSYLSLMKISADWSVSGRWKHSGKKASYRRLALAFPISWTHWWYQNKAKHHLKSGIQYISDSHDFSLGVWLLEFVVYMPGFVTSCVGNLSFWFVFPVLFCSPFLVCLVSLHTTVIVRRALICFTWRLHLLNSLRVCIFPCVSSLHLCSLTALILASVWFLLSF